MKFVSLGRTGILVTPVGMGVLTVGRTQLDLPLREGADIVRHALARGIRFFDTAQYYETYSYIREGIRLWREEDGGDGGKGAKTPAPVIASKSLTHSYSGMAEAVEEMRRSLDLDVVDIFLLHEVRTGGDFAARAGAWECLNDLKAKGVVRAIGLSTHYVDVAGQNAVIAE
ncbi:MAG: aldo/keto reductase, partial [Clostridiales Family XIII bacterium]|nr:aldo/keto reductase [Clostridiales Family XIII bacterium]